MVNFKFPYDLTNGTWNATFLDSFVNMMVTEQVGCILLCPCNLKIKIQQNICDVTHLLPFI